MLVSQAEFGRFAGVSRQRVGQWVRDGIITLVNGKVDIERSSEGLRKNLDGFRRQDWEELHGKDREKGEPFPSFPREFIENLDFSNLELLKPKKQRKEKMTDSFLHFSHIDPGRGSTEREGRPFLNRKEGFRCGLHLNRHLRGQRRRI